MKVLITGIAGMLGSRLAEWILANVPGAEITGIDDLSCGYIENVPQDALLRHKRLGWPDKILGDFFDYIFHFAASAYEGLSPWIRVRNYHDNLLATAQVVNHCLEHPPKRLVFASSMAVYGRQTPPFDESLPRCPIDPYGVAKAASETDIEIAGEQHGLDWCIVRPHNVYGPGQSLWQRYRNVLGLWMQQHIQGIPMTVYGDGSQVRAFSYVDDILPCLWQAAVAPEASRQIINLGGTVEMPILVAAHAARFVMGDFEYPIAHLPARYEVHKAWSTWQKSVDLLGYRQKTPLSDGLTAMWAWAQDAWHRWPSRRNTSDSITLENRNGLPEYWK